MMLLHQGVACLIAGAASFLAASTAEASEDDKGAAFIKGYVYKIDYSNVRGSNNEICERGEMTIRLQGCSEEDVPEHLYEHIRLKLKEDYPKGAPNGIAEINIAHHKPGDAQANPSVAIFTRQEMLALSKILRQLREFKNLEILAFHFFSLNDSEDAEGPNISNTVDLGSVTGVSFSVSDKKFVAWLLEHLKTPNHVRGLALPAGTLDNLQALQRTNSEGARPLVFPGLKELNAGNNSALQITEQDWKGSLKKVTALWIHPASCSPTMEKYLPEVRILDIGTNRIRFEREGSDELWITIASCLSEESVACLAERLRTPSAAQWKVVRVIINGNLLVERQATAPGIYGLLSGFVKTAGEWIYGAETPQSVYQKIIKSLILPCRNIEHLGILVKAKEGLPDIADLGFLTEDGQSNGLPNLKEIAIIGFRSPLKGIIGLDMQKFAGVRGRRASNDQPFVWTPVSEEGVAAIIRTESAR